MIEIDGLSVRFGRNEAVKSVSFNVARGESFGIVGESGSGKSTVLRALSGLNPDWTGRMAVDGQALAPRRSKEFHRRVPTSALDATVQAEILRLIEDLVSRRGMGLILISHDLPLVSHFCDRVAVMYAGRVVEEVAAADLLRARHPYTRGLLECLPTLSHRQKRLIVMQRDPSWLET